MLAVYEAVIIRAKNHHMPVTHRDPAALLKITNLVYGKIFNTTVRRLTDCLIKVKTGPAPVFRRLAETNRKTLKEDNFNYILLSSPKIIDFS